MATPLEIRNLENIPKATLFEAFTLAFEDYLTPISFDLQSTLYRWDLAGISEKHSFGVFEDSRLIAFVLQSSHDKTLYNFCTGVNPKYRGRHLIKAIYEKIDALEGIDLHILEVIKENEKALNLYKKLGFKEVRILNSYQGQFLINQFENSVISYEILPLIYTDEMLQLSLLKPAFENSSATCLKRPHSYEVHQIRKEGKLLAWSVYNPLQLSLKEIGAINGSGEYLDQLFLRMKLNNENLRVMNIDERASSIIKYFETRGLKKFISQYEMTRKS
jgi:GNAT superfamily N-acetyltransferase